MENNISTNLPKKNTPRDLFLHLFAMVALYWSAISFITLCWQYINYFFPDALNYNYGLSGSMRFAIASLIIVFPLFMLVSWVLNGIYRKEAMVRDSRIRKWLIYITLFVAALVIIGDLVFVINTFLGGEVTIRFILKALSILFVAALIFWYYLDDVRRNIPSSLGKYFAWVCIIIISVSVVGAFFIVGSPTKARSLQFDQQRISDLQNIQWQIVNYWQRKQMLPANLTSLNDPISGTIIPIDPQTNVAYEYMIKDAKNLSFELCATFNLADNGQDPMQNTYPTKPYSIEQENQNWNHIAGRTCFERTIDKELYPPFNK